LSASALSYLEFDINVNYVGTISFPC
jgi:hypothetical protein